MSTTIAVVKEAAPEEFRVALTPDVVKRLTSYGFSLRIEHDAGQHARYSDADYVNAGASIGNDVSSTVDQAALVLSVQALPDQLYATLPADTLTISLLNPLLECARIQRLQQQGLTALALELVPRISRAQSMDVLSSQATVAGYKAVLIAANTISGFFPMLTTAAGTIRPATVLVLGAGVAGLQAIATARRLGANVEAYDVRRAAGEQVASLGARFLAIETDDAEAEGGYARALNSEEKAREQAMLADHVGLADVIITTAQIPGRKAPVLLDQALCDRLKPGAVVVDMAAESGGNCVLTQAGETVTHQQARILGPRNLAASLATHASDMYARNLLNLLRLLIPDSDTLAPDWDDEVLAGCCVCRAGKIVNPAVQHALEKAS